LCCLLFNCTVRTEAGLNSAVFLGRLTKEGSRLWWMSRHQEHRNMNVLLLSMPDSFEHMPSILIRMPNGALSSLAGNIDPHHRVAIADLILAQRQVRPTLERLLREFDPDVVALSVMTFQRRTAKKIIQLVRALKPKARVVAGGYDPSLAP